MIAPTRTQMFNQLYKKSIEEWNLFEVRFLQKSESNRDWNIITEIENFLFPYKILWWKQFHFKEKSDNHYFNLNTTIRWKLNIYKPDKIIHAWRASLTVMIALFWSKLNKAHFVLWSWSTKYETSRRRSLTRPMIYIIVKLSDSYRSYGTRASEYLESLWANSKSITKVYNTVDIDYFTSSYKKLSPHSDTLKVKFGIREERVLLYVWQLIKRKGLEELIRWFTIFSRSKSEYCLVIIWTWLLENEYKALVEELWSSKIYFVWYVQKSKISIYYAIADIFVLPSYEEVRWLVVNEAMCFWLPILTTKYVGCTPDLIRENWIVLENINKFTIRDWLVILSNNTVSYSKRSKEIILRYSIDKTVDSISL